MQSNVIEQLSEGIGANHINIVVILDSFVVPNDFLTWFHFNCKWMQPLRAKFLHVSVSGAYSWSEASEEVDSDFNWNDHSLVFVSSTMVLYKEILRNFDAIEHFDVEFVHPGVWKLSQTSFGQS